MEQCVFFCWEVIWLGIWALESHERRVFWSTSLSPIALSIFKIWGVAFSKVPGTWSIGRVAGEEAGQKAVGESQNQGDYRWWHSKVVTCSSPPPTIATHRLWVSSEGPR